MNKVVPFERDARFLRDRAIRGRREGRLLDALQLFRRAAEREGGNSVYQMDEAETLCSMGCFDQSNRVLAGMLSRSGAPNDCYLGMCCNYFGKNELDLAYRALVRFLAGDPNAVNRDEVRQIIKDLVSARMMRDDVDGRKKTRALHLLNRAQVHIADGTPRIAVALSRRVLHIGVKRRIAMTMLAAALLDCGKPQSASRAITRALKRNVADAETLLVATRIFMQLDKPQEATAALNRMPLRDKTLPDDIYLMMLHAAAACLDDECVRAMLPKALRLSPYSVDLLHMCAVNRVREGRPIEHAMSFWTRMLLIDPDDVVARYHLPQAEQGILPTDLSYSYSLPEKTRRENDRKLRLLLPLSDAELTDMFLTDNAQYDLCRYALFLGNEQNAILARAILSRIADPQARKLLCEGSLSADIPASDSIMKTGNGTSGVEIMDLDGNTGSVHMPPFFRKSVKLSIAAARPETDIAAPIVQLMIRCLQKRPARSLSRDLSAWTAALYFGGMRAIDNDITLEQAALHMGASIRKTMRCAQILEVIPRETQAGGNHEAD